MSSVNSDENTATFDIAETSVSSSRLIESGRKSTFGRSSFLFEDSNENRQSTIMIK